MSADRLAEEISALSEAIESMFEIIAEERVRHAECPDPVEQHNIAETIAAAEELLSEQTISLARAARQYSLAKRGHVSDSIEAWGVFFELAGLEFGRRAAEGGTE